MFLRMRAAISEQGESIAISMYNGPTDMTYGSDQEMERAQVQYVSGWMFRTFGLRPAAGRLLNDDDDGAPGQHPYAVISYEYWTRRFGRALPVATMVGTTVLAMLPAVRRALRVDPAAMLRVE